MPFDWDDLDDLEVLSDATELVPDSRRHPWLAVIVILAIIALAVLLIWF